MKHNSSFSKYDQMNTCTEKRQQKLKLNGNGMERNGTECNRIECNGKDQN